MAAVPAPSQRSKRNLKWQDLGFTADEETLFNVLGIQILPYVLPTLALKPADFTFANGGLVSIVDATGTMLVKVTSPADTIANSAANGMHVIAFNETFDGTNWNSFRGAQDITVFVLDVRTTTTNSADQVVFNHRGVRLFLDVTAASGTVPTLDVKIQSRDGTNGKYFDVTNGAFSTATAVSSAQLLIYPGVPAGTGISSQPLSRQWRAVATIGGTTPSFTFSLGATMIL